MGSGDREKSEKGFDSFCGVVGTVLGVGGGIAAAVDGYVTGVAVILISIPVGRLAEQRWMEGC